MELKNGSHRYDPANYQRHLAQSGLLCQPDNINLNFSKTKFILLRKKKYAFWWSTIQINDWALNEGCKEKYFKFVGVYRFDEFLKWDFQLDHICAKNSSAIFALKNVKLPLRIRKLL